ncbi:hypothetical protein ACWKSP_22160 [Micromonosporaceae bacterium Da 78-11]
MSWEPINLAAGAAALKLEILRKAADGLVNLGDDPYEPGEKAYSFEARPGDLFDGSNVTDEVMELVCTGLLSDRGGVIRITDAGRGELAAQS